MKATWAIRDIKHGKTFHFETLGEMVYFCLKFLDTENNFKFISFLKKECLKLK